MDGCHPDIGPKRRSSTLPGRRAARGLKMISSKPASGHHPQVGSSIIALQVLQAEVKISVVKSWQLVAKCVARLSPNRRT